RGRVAVLSKEGLSESNTQYAQGGIAAAIGSDDSPDLHYRDTIKAGAGLCSEEAVRILVDEGPGYLYQLIDMGAVFDRNNGYSLTREAAHSRNRILHAKGDATGAEIERTLLCNIRQHDNITVLPMTMAVDLLTNDGRCCGLIAVDTSSGEARVYTAGSVVIASGGAGHIYRRTTNPNVSTGDGAAMAFRAGAQLADLEFFQFHPTALFLPRAPMFLISEAVRGEGGILRNVRGERFMPMYHQLAELAPRDVVARAIVNEMDKTGADYVYLDLRPIGARAAERFPTICLTCKQFGLDLAKDFIPVAPAAHYYMGGILTDTRGRSSLPGLYACGEAACTMVHGANRLASNSLLEGLVFGHRCVAAMADDNAVKPGVPHVTSNIEQGGGRSASVEDLKRLMWEAAGIIRCREALAGAEKRLNEMPLVSPSGLQRPQLELANMALLARLIVKSALKRTESRGAHFRLDYPHRSKEWQKHILLSPDKEAEIDAH
ncbi:MAG: L-aspartate oxidase, partial [bacterium]|nr:L-aspartate oxidase [bacterium]